MKGDREFYKYNMIGIMNKKDPYTNGFIMTFKLIYWFHIFDRFVILSIYGKFILKREEIQII